MNGDATGVGGTTEEWPREVIQAEEEVLVRFGRAGGKPHLWVSAGDELDDDGELGFGIGSGLGFK